MKTNSECLSAPTAPTCQKGYRKSKIDSENSDRLVCQRSRDQPYQKVTERWSHFWCNPSDQKVTPSLTSSGAPQCFQFCQKRSKFNFVSSRTESKLCLWLHLVAGFKNMVLNGQFWILVVDWLVVHLQTFDGCHCLLDKTGNDSDWLIETLFLIGPFPIGWPHVWIILM